MSQTTIDITTATAALKVVDEELSLVEAENESLRWQLDEARSLAERLHKFGMPDGEDGAIVFIEASAVVSKWKAVERAATTDTIDDWHACNQPHTSETT